MRIMRVTVKKGRLLAPLQIRIENQMNLDLEMLKIADHGRN
jgi:hypothetical protein